MNNIKNKNKKPLTALEDLHLGPPRQTWTGTGGTEPHQRWWGRSAFKQEEGQPVRALGPNPGAVQAEGMWVGHRCPDQGLRDTHAQQTRCKQECQAALN